MQIKKPIILTEFPKSGGSWVASMLGDALRVPVRDIYVRPGFDLFELQKHPWYQNVTDFDFTAQSIIKSHELPGSSLIDFDATYIHLIRDGRDVVISKWFFDKDFCVKNGITTSFQKQFDNYVEETAREWFNYINVWAKQPVVVARYEDFLSDPVKNLGYLLTKITNRDFSQVELEITVRKYTKEKFSAALSETFRYNSFVRKGISGDWRNYFSEQNITSFKMAAGEALLSLGYELNSCWHI